MSDEDDDYDAHMQLLAEYESGELQDPPLSSTLNHGGPGICRLCHPSGATKVLQQQAELFT